MEGIYYGLSVANTVRPEDHRLSDLSITVEPQAGFTGICGRIMNLVGLGI
jgi:hypothetical protein